MIKKNKLNADTSKYFKAAAVLVGGCPGDQCMLVMLPTSMPAT